MYPLPLRPEPDTQAEYTAEWLEIADSIGADRFSEGLIQAVRESDYFPTISKLRACCGVTETQQSKAGADAAWSYVLAYIAKGYACDWYQNPPKLPARIAHAVRMVGGIRGIQSATDREVPFLRKDFCEAWDHYVESAAAFGNLLLQAPLDVKLLPVAKDAPTLTGKPGGTVNAIEALSMATQISTPTKAFRAPLTDEEIERKKAEALKEAEKFQRQECAS